MRLSIPRKSLKALFTKFVKIDPVYSSGVTVALVLFCFLLFTLPLAFERVAGGRSAERQGYTAGIIRIYCQEPAHSVLKGPQIHFGRNPFNLELTVFEWAQGITARVIGGEGCDTTVEILGKIFSIICSAIGILGVALLATHLWGPVAGCIAAILLGTDELWLRYATYTMIENRVLTFGVFAILFSLRRRPVAAGLCWALTFLQKPQIFVFCTAFWLATEFALARSFKLLVASKRFRKVCVAFAGASLTGFAWFGWSNHVGIASDLPWIIHTGPRIKNWYFGNWQERVSLGYVKQLLLAWFKESGVNAGLPLIAALWFTGADAADLKLLLKRALPLLAALFVYTFTFYPVFIVHEYYALPLNVGRALTTAAVLGLAVEALPKLNRRLSRLTILTLVCVVAVVGRYAIIGLHDYSKFALNINNPEVSFYHPDWNHQVFPKKHGFSVVVVPGSGRDLLFLYLNGQRGFVWCLDNPENAPRAFWKAQGVESVGWWDGIDLKTRLPIWNVRSIDEELAYARAHSWSSDIHDVWAGKSMAEWAALASATGRDPCLNAKDYDPRKW